MLNSFDDAARLLPVPPLDAANAASNAAAADGSLLSLLSRHAARLPPETFDDLASLIRPAPPPIERHELLPRSPHPSAQALPALPRGGGSADDEPSAAVPVADDEPAAATAAAAPSLADETPMTQPPPAEAAQTSWFGGLFGGSGGRGGGAQPAAPAAETPPALTSTPGRTSAAASAPDSPLLHAHAPPPEPNADVIVAPAPPPPLYSLELELASLRRELEHATASLAASRAESTHLLAALESSRTSEESLRAESRLESARASRDARHIRGLVKRDEELSSALADVMRERESVQAELSAEHREAVSLRRVAREHEAAHEATRRELRVLHRENAQLRARLAEAEAAVGAMQAEAPPQQHGAGRLMATFAAGGGTSPVRPTRGGECEPEREPKREPEREREPEPEPEREPEPEPERDSEHERAPAREEPAGLARGVAPPQAQPPPPPAQPPPAQPPPPPPATAPLSSAVARHDAVPFAVDDETQRLLESGAEQAERRLTELALEKDALESELARFPPGSGRSLAARRRKSAIESRLDAIVLERSRLRRA